MTTHDLPATSVLYERARLARLAVKAPWFTAPWDLNMLVVRSGAVGRFDDFVLLACTDDAGRQVVQVVWCTADAWTGEWTAPTHPDGCVYTLDGHYAGGLERGEHRGRPALRQVKPFRYVRWPRGMGRVPTVAELVARAAAQHAFSAICGTHWHNRAGHASPDVPRTDDSEGCTVSLHQHEHAAGIHLVEQQRLARGSAVVSPTYLSRAVLGV